MNVRELCEFLARAGDHLDVLVPGNDHSYRMASVRIAEMAQDGPDYFDPDVRDIPVRAIVVE